MNKEIKEVDKNPNPINIIPSKLDDILGKACPSVEDGNENISSIWNYLHEIFNARLAQDLKKSFSKLKVQHEISDGNSRLDIRLVSDYQNKVFLGEKNIVVIDMKTGKVKLYQLCLYSVKNSCPVIISELLTGNVHLLTVEIAEKILENVPDLLEKIKELKNLNANIPGKDCKVCSKECTDRIAKYSPYEISAYTFGERALKLESNYNIIKEKVEKIIKSLIEDAVVRAHSEEKKTNNVSISSETNAVQSTSNSKIQPQLLSALIFSVCF